MGLYKCVSSGGSTFPTLALQGSASYLYIANEDFNKYSTVVVNAGSNYVVLRRSNSLSTSGAKELAGRGLANQTWTYTITDTDRTYNYLILGGASATCKIHLE